MPNIIIAVSDGYKGYGDFLFALKLAHAQQIKMNALDGDPLDPPRVYLVTENSGKEKILQLQGDKEYQVNVVTADELKAMHLTEVQHVVVGPVCNESLLRNIDDALPDLLVPTKMTAITEYSCNEKLLGIQPEISLSHIKFNQFIYSGPNPYEQGILISNNSLSRDDRISQLDPKVRELLFPAHKTFENYNQSTDLGFQYSHDQPIPQPDSDDSSAVRYLKVFCETCIGKDKDQDVVMVGASKEEKHKALESIKDKLVADGFTRVLFVDANNQTEEELPLEALEGKPIAADQKTFRVIYLKSTSHQCMEAVCSLAGSFVGATGDQSFGEAVSFNKLFLYECLGHKKDLIGGYYNSLLTYVPEEDKAAVISMFSLLHGASSEAEYRQLSDYLRDQRLQQLIMTANQQLLNHKELSQFIFDTILDNSKPLNAKELQQKSPPVEPNVAEAGAGAEPTSAVERQDNDLQVQPEPNTSLIRSSQGTYQLENAVSMTGGWSQLHKAKQVLPQLLETPLLVKVINKSFPSQNLPEELLCFKSMYPEHSFDLISDDQNDYFVMPLLPGTSLDTFLTNYETEEKQFNFEQSESHQSGPCLLVGSPLYRSELGCPNFYSSNPVLSKLAALSPAYYISENTLAMDSLFGQAQGFKLLKKNQHQEMLDILGDKPFVVLSNEQLKLINNKMPLFSAHKNSRADLAVAFLTQLKTLHEHGMTHNDLKLKNVLFDSSTNSMHIVDYGCARKEGSYIKYQGTQSAIFALEFPPEYLNGALTHSSMDIYAATALVSQLLGVNQKELVKERVIRAFKQFDPMGNDISGLKKKIIDALDEPLMKHMTVEEIFLKVASQCENSLSRSFESFIPTYVKTPYDFSPYDDRLSNDVIALLNRMQAQNPEDRPSAEECIQVIKMSPPAIDPARKKIIQELMHPSPAPQQLEDNKEVIAVPVEEAPAEVLTEEEQLIRQLESCKQNNYSSKPKEFGKEELAVQKTIERIIQKNLKPEMSVPLSVQAFEKPTISKLKDPSLSQFILTNESLFYYNHIKEEIYKLDISRQELLALIKVQPEKAFIERQPLMELKRMLDKKESTCDLSFTSLTELHSLLRSNVVSILDKSGQNKTSFHFKSKTTLQDAGIPIIKPAPDKPISEKEIQLIDKLTRKGQLTLIAEQVSPAFLKSVEQMIQQSSVVFTDSTGQKSSLVMLYEKTKRTLTMMKKCEPEFSDVLLQMYTHEDAFFRKLNGITGGYGYAPGEITPEEREFALVLDVAMHKAVLTKLQNELQLPPIALFRGQTHDELANRCEKTLEYFKANTLNLDSEQLIELDIAKFVAKKAVSSTSSNLQSVEEFLNGKPAYILHIKNPKEMADFCSVSNISAMANEEEWVARIPDDVALIPTKTTVIKSMGSDQIHVECFCIRSENVLEARKTAEQIAAATSKDIPILVSNSQQYEALYELFQEEVDNYMKALNMIAASSTHKGTTMLLIKQSIKALPDIVSLVGTDSASEATTLSKLMIKLELMHREIRSQGSHAELIEPYKALKEAYSNILAVRHDLKVIHDPVIPARAAQTELRSAIYGLRQWVDVRARAYSHQAPQTAVTDAQRELAVGSKLKGLIDLILLDDQQLKAMTNPDRLEMKKHLQQIIDFMDQNSDQEPPELRKMIERTNNLLTTMAPKNSPDKKLPKAPSVSELRGQAILPEKQKESTKEFKTKYQGIVPSKLPEAPFSLINRFEEQKGWNCFDVAAGFDREALVAYALDHSSDPDVRKLLAPEIRHAAMLAIEGNGDKHALPAAMVTPELLILLNRYQDAPNNPSFKKTYSKCYDRFIKAGEERLNPDEMFLFFQDRENQDRYPREYVEYTQAYTEHILPVEKAFEDYVNSEAIYRDYIQTYYANNQWVAFQADASTNIIDIAARMLNQVIVIYEPDSSQPGSWCEKYRTKNGDDSTPELPIQFHVNHFVALEPTHPDLSAAEAIASHPSN